ncbi:MAG TPA: hypothetical protein VF103_00130, partial [Polyangiaceae bacterium]
MKRSFRLPSFLVLLSAAALAVLSATVSPALARARRDEVRAPLDAVAADRLRIRVHLSRVERELRMRDTSSLEPSARSARERALDALFAYTERGVFPRNTRHPSE